ncbi:MAG: serpin family protein [Caldilineaceae bacterium]
MLRLPRWIAVVLVVLLVGGCASTLLSPLDATPTATPQPTRVRTKPTPVPLTDAAEQLAQANNTFGFDLLAQLHTESPEENLFFSPLSMALALQMIYNGASEDIQDEAATVLHLPSTSVADLNEANRVLQGNLRAEEIELLIANSIWLNSLLGAGLFEDFAERMNQSYDAEVAELDFADPESVNTINGWVDEQTKGEITKVLQDTPADIALYLVNAIYFKGDWQEQFDPAQTSEEPFTLADGTQKNFPLMHQSNAFRYYQGENFALAALPYGEEGRMQMVLLLPDEGTPLESLLADLNPETWQQWVAAMNQGQLFVALPRFGAEYTNEQMLDTLAILGLPTRGYTDISASAAGRISQFIHKAIVKVNEEGTVAAAVSVGAMPSSGPPSFIVNRPFFLTIQDSETGAILFMGAIYDPQPLEE